MSSLLLGKKAREWSHRASPSSCSLTTSVDTTVDWWSNTRSPWTLRPTPETETRQCRASQWRRAGEAWRQERTSRAETVRRKRRRSGMRMEGCLVAAPNRRERVAGYGGSVELTSPHPRDHDRSAFPNDDAVADT